MTTRGTINGEPYEVPDGYTVVSDAYAANGSQALRLLSDLDRSPNGRHEGDDELQDPSGYSQGNPLLREGQHIGWTISGARIVVPPAHKLADPEAWIADAPASDEGGEGK